MTTAAAVTAVQGSSPVRAVRGCAGLAWINDSQSVSLPWHTCSQVVHQCKKCSYPYHIPHDLQHACQPTVAFTFKPTAACHWQSLILQHPDYWRVTGRNGLASRTVCSTQVTTQRLSNPSYILCAVTSYGTISTNKTFILNTSCIPIKVKKPP